MYNYLNIYWLKKIIFVTQICCMACMHGWCDSTWTIQMGIHSLTYTLLPCILGVICYKMVCSFRHHDIYSIFLPCVINHLSKNQKQSENISYLPLFFSSLYINSTLHLHSSPVIIWGVELCVYPNQQHNTHSKIHRACSAIGVCPYLASCMSSMPFILSSASFS